MNASQRKSLELIKELLNNMDSDTFLKEYESVERNIGPTVAFFLTQNYFRNFLKTTKIDCSNIERHYERKAFSYKGQNDIYSANNESYFEQLAA